MQRGFGLIWLLLALVIVGAISAGGYLYYQSKNQTLPKISPMLTPSPTKVEPTPTTGPTLTPIPTSQAAKISNLSESENGPALKIKVSGEKLFKVEPNGQLQPLEEFIDNDYQMTVTDLIVNFSPDKTKFYLLGQGGITPLLFYWSPVTNPQLRNIGEADKLAWSHNSRFLAYTSRHSDCGPVTGFGVYDTIKDQPLNVGPTLNDPDFKYEDLGLDSVSWSSDDKTVKVGYSAYDGQGCGGGGKTLKTGQLSVPINN